MQPQLRLLLMTVFVFVLSMVSRSQTVIVSDGLNGSSSLFNLSGGVFLSGNSGANDRPASSPYAFEGSHSYGVTSGTATLVSSSNINTSAYCNPALSFRVAAFSSNTTNGLDASDSITVRISVDGGVTYSTTNYKLVGFDNAWWAFSAVDSAKFEYGSTSSIIGPTAGGAGTTPKYGIFTVTNLPAITNLRVSISIRNQSNETWLIDEVRLSGSLPKTWYLDLDNDGYYTGSSVSACSSPGTGYKNTGLTGGNDCNDNAIGGAAINPGATEVCDGVDNDCDGSIDEGVKTTFYRDADGDGFGNPNVTTQACSVPSGYVSDNTDCDDALVMYQDGDSDGFGSTIKVACNGVINNTDCNDALVMYQDLDGDTYGSPIKVACGGVTSSSDCNDNTVGGAVINPAATEICDGVDNDCDGSIDEGVKTTFYQDNDGDGFGNPNATTQACSMPAGYVADNTDCNDNLVMYGDSDADGFGSSVKVACNGVLNNTDCNDNLVMYLDNDNDGFGSTTKVACNGVTNSTDCNDSQAGVNPGATEICNSIDDDCDGFIDEGVKTTFYRDADGDTYGDLNNTTQACSLPAGYVTNSSDCNDGDAALNPNTIWYLDADGDGYYTATTQSCESPGTGYTRTVTAQGDCAPADPNKWRLGTFYRDFDGDGYDDGQEQICYGGTVPSTHKSTTLGTDCDDTDNAKWRTATLYQDVDGDTYTVGNGEVKCYGINYPSGWIATKSLVNDCNDNDATINPYAPAPTGSATQSFVGAATVANLAATGSNIQWYATSNGGTALSTGAALITGNTYYASQTIGSCESVNRLAVKVILTEQIITSINNGTFCAGDEMTITFKTTGTYQTGNVFRAELSNGGGNFAPGNPNLLTTVSLTNDGSSVDPSNGVEYTYYTMLVKIPIIRNSADHYYLRINASKTEPNGLPLLGREYRYDNIGFIINPAPDNFTVTGGGAYCAGGSGVTIGLDDSENGVNYLLYHFTSITDSALITTVAGTGGGISFGQQTTAGLYKVKAVFTNGTGCGIMMSGSATVVVNAVPQSGILTKNQDVASVCAGTSVSASFTAGSGGAGTITDVLQYRTNGGNWLPYTSNTPISTAAPVTSVDIRTFRTATGSGCTTSSVVMVSWNVGVVVQDASTITGDNKVCFGDNSKTYTINAVAGATTYTWTVPQNATIVSGQGTSSIEVNFGTATPGAATIGVTPSSTCFTGGSSSLSIVIYPTAPSIIATDNTCNAAFTLPTVSAVTGFTVQYKIDNGSWATNPSTTAIGCHTVKARYVYTADGSAAPAACAESNAVNVVVFPAKPELTSPANTCAAAFTLPSVTAASGFTVQYSINNGTWATAPSVPTTPGCYSIKARYVLNAACGGNPANAVAPEACIESDVVYAVIFPAKPSAPVVSNTCVTTLTIPALTAVTGFVAEYSFDGGTTWSTTNSSSSTTPGCYTLKSRYVLQSACGANAASATAPTACAESNASYAVIFPAKPTAIVNADGQGPIQVTPPATVTGFDIQYSFNDGSTWGSNNPPTVDNCGGYKIKVRYVTSAACGAIDAGTSSSCSTSDAVTRKLDNTKPTLSGLVNKSVNTDAGQCYATVALGSPVASDNCDLAPTVTNDAPVNFPLGTTTVTWTVTDMYGNSRNYSQTVTVNNITTITTVTVTPTSQQYSDLVTFTATIAPYMCGDKGNAVDSVRFKIGTQVMGTAKVGSNGVATLTTALLEPIPTPVPNPLTFPITGELNPRVPLSPLGEKTVTAVFTSKDADYVITDPTTKLTITPEDARVTYIGSLFTSTSSTSTGTAKVMLSATIQDITAITPGVDANAGDIRNARVYFKIVETGFESPRLTPGLVNANNQKTGTVFYEWNVDIGSADSRQYTIMTIVEGYYHRNASDDNVVVTVSKPLDDFITGGGYIVLTENASGLINPKPGTKNNFGFNVKYNKSRTNLQGNINTIVRGMDNRVYQVKGNRMNSLSVNGATASSPASAVFNGQASIQDITNPDSVFSVDGGATLQVSMVDYGEPGKDDQIAITVYNKNGGLWFTSNWTGVQTQLQQLAGGNLKVHNAGSFKPGTGAITMTLVSDNAGNISTVGAPVTFTATVNPTSGIIRPTGSVTFVRVNGTTGTAMGTFSLPASGVVIFTTTSLPAGTHTITAYYGGDSKFENKAATINPYTVNNVSATIVHNGRSSQLTEVGEKQSVQEMSLNAFPNPTMSSFTVQVISDNTKVKIEVRVLDMHGRVIQILHNLNSGQTIQIGSKYRPGTYVVEMIQGDKRKQMKVVKNAD